MKKCYGFHLIEILITLVIISIITAFAVPYYANYLVKARRAEAISMLSKLALAMEQFHLENNTYENVSLSQLQFPQRFASNQYQLQISLAKHNDYLISAKPLGKQAKLDVDCGTLSLDANEKRKISGSGDINECWV